MDQKPEIQVSRMAAGIAIGAVLGLLLLFAMDSFWGFPIGIFIGILIGGVWDILRKGKDRPSEN
jgi:F0F1-type ATP synthase assembly protein I